MLYAYHSTEKIADFYFLQLLTSRELTAIFKNIYVFDGQRAGGNQEARVVRRKRGAKVIYCKCARKIDSALFR